MKFVSSLRMKEIDRQATEKFAIPSLILMENAGRSVADEATKMIGMRPGRVVIFCGYGNNGGDGFVSARHLVNRGYTVDTYLVGKQKPMSSDTKINFEILNRMGVKIKRVANEKQLDGVVKIFNKTKLIIDAIFGIGIKGKLDKLYCRLIERINSSRIHVLAIDIPSGLDADKGVALTTAIKAKKTVTMGLAKKGFIKPSAKEYLGKVVLADISLPSKLK